MQYINNKGIGVIEQIEYSKNFQLQIKFNGNKQCNIIFSGLESYYIHTPHGEYIYDFLVDDLQNRLIVDEDFEMINRIFPYQYSKEWFLSGIANKLSLLFIEGNLTIYAIYGKHEYLN